MIDLAGALEAEGGMLAELVPPVDELPTHEPGPAQLAASGPRTAGEMAEYELLLEMIYEGSLLHYGSGRVVRTDDADLALLLGDQLYALGLTRLASLGDLEAVGALADVISRLAQAHAEGDSGSAPDIWGEGAVAIGWGDGPGGS
jgi:hypothetical protein